MTVESVTYISDLEPARPQGGDSIAQGDDHIRNIKKAIKQTFPNIDGEVLASDEEINHLVGVTKPITEIINDTNQDVTDLDARVTKNEQDIAQNTSDIADLRTDLDAGGQDLTALEGKVDANTAAIAEKADKTYVDDELAKKADKSDLDGLDDYGHWKLAVRGDLDWHEVGSREGIMLDSGFGVEIERRTITDTEHFMFSVSQDFRDQVDGNESDIAALQSLVSDLQAQVDKLGGGMITAIQQPNAAGDFTVQGTDQTYKADVAIASSVNKTFTVPADKVFCLEYIFGVAGTGGTMRVDVDQIYIDGVRMYSTNQGYLNYSDSGGPTWPGNDRGPIIRVNEKIEFKGIYNAVSTADLFVAGFFTEA